LQQRRILVLTGVARDHRHAVVLHQVLGAGLGAHLAHRGRAGADEHETGGFDRFGEIGILRQKAVTGMDRFCARAFRSVEDHVAAQITLGRARTADMHGFVGLDHVLRVRVGIGIDGDGGDAESTAAANHATGDFAAVGDQDFAEHEALLAGAAIVGLNPPTAAGACRGMR
jgi:hypothetical protein